jgi:hypothetical protein
MSYSSMEQKMGLNGPLSHTIFEIMRRKEKKLKQYYKNGVYVTEGGNIHISFTSTI